VLSLSDDSVLKKIKVADDIDDDDDVVRLLFWTNVGRYQQIESSSLDGSSRQTLLSGGFLSLSSLAVDSQSRRVFWADSRRHRIESVAYDGSARRSVVDERLQEPGAVAVVGPHVYWVDEAAKTVERADKETGRERLIVKTRLTQPTDIVAVIHDTSSQDRCVNVCGRLRCSHLCVVQTDATARCSCPLGMSLSDDSPSCVRVVSDCRADQVRCSDGGACVPRCDGVGDCPDLVDELACYGSCLLSEFQCLSGTVRCVSSSARCDGRADCDDASDEARCVKCSRSDALLCRADDRCIGAELVCDGRRDCSDAQDERHCSPADGAVHRRAAVVVVGSACALLLLVFVALSAVLWRRGRVARHDKPPNSCSLPTVSSKRGSAGLHAMIAAVSSTSYRAASSYRSPLYDRVPPGSTSSSGSTSVSSVPLCRCYPAETLNPPPSPCTSQCSASQRRHGVMTPCSTDVCDDVDSAAALSSWQFHRSASVNYETEPLYRPAYHCAFSRCTDDDRTSSIHWYTGLRDDATTTMDSYDGCDCDHHQHTVTRATSPLSSVS